MVLSWSKFSGDLLASLFHLLYNSPSVTVLHSHFPLFLLIENKMLPLVVSDHSKNGGHWLATTEPLKKERVDFLFVFFLLAQWKMREKIGHQGWPVKQSSPFLTIKISLFKWKANQDNKDDQGCGSPELARNWAYFLIKLFSQTKSKFLFCSNHKPHVIFFNLSLVGYIFCCSSIRLALPNGHRCW